MNLNIDTLKQQAAENPMGALVAAAGVIASIAKLADALSAAQGRRAYAKQVNNSIKRSKKK